MTFYVLIQTPFKDELFTVAAKLISSHPESIRVFDSAKSEPI